MHDGTNRVDQDEIAKVSVTEREFARRAYADKVAAFVAEVKQRVTVEA